MARKTRTTTLVWLRRAVQSAFLLLFLYLFLETVYHPINRVGGGVKLFFQLDPLVMLTDWLASHALAAGLLLSLATVAVTLLFGRWFCGWICPFGTLHHFFGSLRQRMGGGGYTRWHKAKYYVLAVFLGGVWLFRNWQRLVIQRGRTPRLNVLEVRSLGGRHALYVVGYEQERFLVAASPAGVNLVSHLQSISEEPPDTKDAAPAPFAQTLARILKGK